MPWKIIICNCTKEDSPERNWPWKLIIFSCTKIKDSNWNREKKIWKNKIRYGKKKIRYGKKKSNIIPSDLDEEVA